MKASNPGADRPIHQLLGDPEKVSDGPSLVDQKIPRRFALVILEELVQLSDQGRQLWNLVMVAMHHVHEREQNILVVPSILK